MNIWLVLVYSSLISCTVVEDHSQLTKSSLKRFSRLGRVISRPLRSIHKGPTRHKNDDQSVTKGSPLDELSMGANSLDSTVIIKNVQSKDVPNQVSIPEKQLRDFETQFKGFDISDPSFGEHNFASLEIQDQEHNGKGDYEPEIADIIPEFADSMHSLSYRSQVLGYIKGNLIAKLSPEKFIKTDWSYLLSHDIFGWPEELTYKSQSGKNIPKNPEFMTNKELTILENNLSRITFHDFKYV